MSGGIEDPRFTEELLTAVLAAFEAAGYHRASDRHVVTTIGLLGELARIYAGERPASSGVSGAELAARRTVALAIAGDFQAERSASTGGSPPPDWQTWALRLAGSVDLLANAPDSGAQDLRQALGRLRVLEGAVEGLRQDLAAADTRAGLLEAARAQDSQVLAEVLAWLRRDGAR